MLKDYLAIALGGALGASARFTVGLVLQKFSAQTGFPLATMLVNVVGSFILGWLTFRSEGMPRFWLLLITTGFLGSLTTFSTFKVETIKLMDDSKLLHALLYFAGNLLLGIGAVLLAKRLAN